MKYGLAEGIIDEDELRSRFEMSKRTKFLKEHEKKYSIWFSESTNYWTTTLPDETKKQKRRIIKRRNRKDLEDAIVQFYKENEDNPTVEETFYRWIDRRLHEYDDFAKQTANKQPKRSKR